MFDTFNLMGTDPITMEIVVEEGNVDVGNTAEPSYEVVALSGCSAQLSTNDIDKHELAIESKDSKVSVGNAAKQSHDVVGVGIDCIFNHAKVSTEADLGPQSDVIHLTSLDVTNESSQISSDADMVEQNKQDALDTLIKISQHKKPKKLNVARVVSEALSAYIHCIRGEEHLPHREGGKVFLENTFISSLLKRDGDPKVLLNCVPSNEYRKFSLVPGSSKCKKSELKGLERQIKLAAEHKELYQDKWSNLDVASWPVIEKITTQMQTDGVSCGLWMINYMEYWTGSSLSDNDDITMFRFKLPAILWDSRLNTKKKHQNLDHNVDEDGESSSDVQIIDTPCELSKSSNTSHQIEPYISPYVLPAKVTLTNTQELMFVLCTYIMGIDNAKYLKKHWIQSTKPYPISLSLQKLKDILDVNKPMDTDCFNMAVRMIACNDALFLLEDKYHYMDLQLCILLPFSFMGHFTLYVLNMDTRSIYIMDSMPIPSWFKGDHPSMHYIHNIHYIANNMNAAMELANPTWKDDIYMRRRIVPTWVPRTLNWDLSGFLVINFMHDWNGIRLPCICTHCNLSPLPAYEPAFDWENERSLIFGQRVPESIPAISNSGLKITVKVLSLSFQAGLVEPFSGTICLYNRDRREKLSEDFYFHILPTDMQDAQGSLDRRGVFSLDTHSPSVCLLIQLEKAATEEGGVTPSVYSHKEPEGHMLTQLTMADTSDVPIEDPLSILNSRTDDNHALELRDKELLVSELQNTLDQKSKQLGETEIKLSAMMDEVNSLKKELEQTRGLLDESQMNCAHLENCLHEAIEEARTNKCLADRRAVEYDALRSSALRIHGLFERLNNCITAPGVTGFAKSLHSLAASLASSVKKDEADTTVQFQQCIKILADKVYLLTRQSAELLERYSAMQAVHGGITKELDEKKELIKNLYNKLQQEKQPKQPNATFSMVFSIMNSRVVWYAVTVRQYLTNQKILIWEGFTIREHVHAWLGSKVAMFQYSSVKIYNACKPQPTLEIHNPDMHEWYGQEIRNVCIVRSWRSWTSMLYTAGLRVINFAAKWRRYMYIFPLDEDADLILGEAQSSKTLENSEHNIKPQSFDVAKVDEILQPLAGKTLSYKMFARDTQASRSVLQQPHHRQQLSEPIRDTNRRT
ncbi:hypothetical protein ZEAMMB73_Zm00001d007025 [Zea mays]|uniref:Ubiquitin-like protease family profile domain-containing protein n=1 Tax=Zea mays TaxID=4577 RepID=A0A1D6F2B6_MAIZE|nr:hypothetical protein ZEAMMB73_Zm00001d007025 [Zea mays]